MKALSGESVGVLKLEIVVGFYLQERGFNEEEEEEPNSKGSGRK